jgi:protein ImuA
MSSSVVALPDRLQTRADARINPRIRAQVLHELRCLLPKMESAAATMRALPFGLPALDSHLPQGGLLAGALHEIAPATYGDTPAAFGFLVALLGRMTSPKTPVLLVSSPRGIADHGRPSGHGVNRLGLDPARLILVETADEAQALWAMEEALRSRVPAAVAGAIKMLDLKTSQRLHFAAADAGRPLLLLRPADATEASAAATRWRIAAARAAPDRFGLIARWRWSLALERCRNGRPGQWLVEFDHAAHRFSLAAPLADPALSRRANTPSCPRAPSVRQAG